MQYWEDVLYPRFLSSISGDMFAHMSDEAISELCYSLATRAISAFKFPKVSLSYSCTYLDAKGNIVTKMDNWVVQKWYFVNEVGEKEISVLVGWMKAMWMGDLNSNSDNFSELYTDPNIKTYSRANAIDKNIKLYQTFIREARNLEHDYSRVSKDGKPALGEVNEE